jgi:hypothetical protein
VVLRVSHPGKPVKLIDLGPHGNGQRRPWDAMRKTIDDLPKSLYRQLGGSR